MSQDLIFPKVNPHVHGTKMPFFPNVDVSIKPTRGRGHPTKYQGELTVQMTYEYLAQCEEKYVAVRVKTEEGADVQDDRYSSEGIEGDETRTVKEGKGKDKKTKQVKIKVRSRTIYRPELPTVAGLATYLGVSRDTIYAWRDEHTEYSDTIKVLLQIQETKLINGGISGQYNSKVASLILSSTHDYREKKEIQHQGLSLGDLHSAQKDINN